MQELQLPPVQFQIRETKQRTQIFDVFRNKYVVLTPEEWVRQHVAHYLVNHLNYPKGLIQLEASLVFNGLKKRADIIVYNKNLQPVVLVECKQMNVKISQHVFDQIAVYNRHFNVPYLFVSNGIDHFCARVDKELETLIFLKDLPNYKALEQY